MPDDLRWSWCHNSQNKVHRIANKILKRSSKTAHPGLILDLTGKAFCLTTGETLWKSPLIFFFFYDYFFLLKPRNNIKQNEEAKPQRNVARYFKKYECIVGPSEDLQNKGVWPQLSLPLQAELYWRIPEVLKADKFSGLLESLTKTSGSASRSLTISRNDLSILQNLFPSFPFILVWKPIARSRF